MRACLSLDSRFRDVQTCRKGELKKVIKAIFSIRDKKAGVFLAPFFTDNVATARRQLALPANSEESFLGIYPEDYDVYNLGTWDDNSGQIEMKPVPDFCFCISELAKKKEVKVHDEKSESATA
nr:MAG: nonstructural protein [Microvirus sp.]